MCSPILSLFLPPGFFSFSVVGVRLFAYCCCGCARAPFRTTELHFPAVPLFSVACSPSTPCCGKSPSLCFVFMKPNWKASCKKVTRGLTETGKVMTPFGQSSPSLCTLQHTATHCNTLQHTATHCNRQSPHTLRAVTVALTCTSGAVASQTSPQKGPSLLHLSLHGTWQFPHTYALHTHALHTPAKRRRLDSKGYLSAAFHTTQYIAIYIHTLTRTFAHRRRLDSTGYISAAPHSTSYVAISTHAHSTLSHIHPHTPKRAVVSNQHVSASHRARNDM